MMNAQHYAKVKSICDWLKNLDNNGTYDEIYKQWSNMDTQGQLIELEYLESILNEYLSEEEDKDYIRSFRHAISTVVEIQNELVEG